jgi:hypothetical protein
MKNKTKIKKKDEDGRKKGVIFVQQKRSGDSVTLVFLRDG